MEERAGVVLDLIEAIEKGDFEPWSGVGDSVQGEQFYLDNPHIFPGYKPKDTVQ